MVEGNRRNSRWQLIESAGVDVLIWFCNERIAPVDLPGAKLVVLKRTN